MILITTILILIVVFAATRYGFKSRSQTIRVVSYVSVFLAIAVLFYLLTVYLTQKFADDLPIL